MYRPAAALLALAALTGCSRGELNSTVDYCAALAEQSPLLARTPKSQLEVDALVLSVRTLTSVAPVAVDDHWIALDKLVRAAASADLNDPTVPQRLANQAYATANSARTIREHASRVCKVELPQLGEVAPPITRIAPPEPVASAPETSPQPTTTEPTTTATAITAAPAESVPPATPATTAPATTAPATAAVTTPQAAATTTP